MAQEVLCCRQNRWTGCLGKMGEVIPRVLAGLCLMKFAFLIHPLTNETKDLMQLDAGGVLRDNWGYDILQFCLDLHSATEALKQGSTANAVSEARMVDELADLASSAG